MAPLSKIHLEEKLLRFYGQNYPINYNPSYNFEEQWEDRKLTHEKNVTNYLNIRSPIATGIEIVRMVVLAVTIWFSTVEFFIKK